MMAETTTLDETQKGIFIREYEQCNFGYNSRDLIAGELFSKLIHTFSFFLALLFGVNVFSSINHNLRTLLGVAIAFLGIVSLGSLLLDLEGTASVKVVLRRRMREIERLFANLGAPRIWTLIDRRRNRYLEEILFKRLEQTGRRELQEKETELEIFVVASRLFLGLWIVVSLAIILWGESLSLHVPA